MVRRIDASARCIRVGSDPYSDHRDDFATYFFVDPFGNIMGIMTNPNFAKTPSGAA